MNPADQAKALRKLKQHRKAKNVLEAKINTLTHNLLKGHIDENEVVFHVIGGWGCNLSPIGYCVYHEYRDPGYDHCIYCGQPAERK